MNTAKTIIFAIGVTADLAAFPGRKEQPDSVWEKERRLYLQYVVHDTNLRTIMYNGFQWTYHKKSDEIRLLARSFVTQAMKDFHSDLYNSALHARSLYVDVLYKDKQIFSDGYNIEDSKSKLDNIMENDCENAAMDDIRSMFMSFVDIFLNAEF
jgi:hypothetical protein